jgi:uncharacterized protein
LRGSYPALFRDVPWSTDKALEVSRQRAEEAGLRSGLLPCWYDVDEPSDLVRPELTDTRHNASRTRNYLLMLNKAVTRGGAEKVTQNE